MNTMIGSGQKPVLRNFSDFMQALKPGSLLQYTLYLPIRNSPESQPRVFSRMEPQHAVFLKYENSDWVSLSIALGGYWSFNGAIATYIVHESPRSSYEFISPHEFQKLVSARLGASAAAALKALNRMGF